MKLEKQDRSVDTVAPPERDAEQKRNAQLQAPRVLSLEELRLVAGGPESEVGTGTQKNG